MIEHYHFPVVDLLTGDPIGTFTAEVDDFHGVLIGLEEAAKRVEQAAEQGRDDVMAFADPDLAKPVPSSADIDPLQVVTCDAD